MSRVSHTKRVTTVEQLVRRLERRLAAANLFYGHGTDNALDDAAAIVWHVMAFPPRIPPSYWARPVSATRRRQVEALVRRRIRERVPVVYLTRRCWFAGLPMYVDERVLIPRSPLAEMIERGFEPWIQGTRVRRVLDIGTGSGCIAIACARAFGRARVDALDIDPGALAVAAINVRMHRLSRRVTLIASDYFSALKRQRYDIIVSNPPYVGGEELAGLPAEYAHEPVQALLSGPDGLDAVRAILRDAGRFLKAKGILVVEVGNSEQAVRRKFRNLPFTWLEFERGGGGVFLLTREQLRAGGY